MRAIVIFITVEVAALIGYYLGRFLAQFAINRFTYRFLRTLDGPLADVAPEWLALRRVQRFGSAGAGALASLAVWVFSQQLSIEVPFGLWLFTSLIVAWFAAASGITGRLPCSVIAFVFYWAVYALTVLFNHVA
jgi:hypothetical protein